jgi:nucleotide-binding universal stress UspA family protein
MKTILIPTDFSKNARNATLYALSSFNIERDRFILLNTYSIPNTARSGMLTDLTADMRREAKRDLYKEKEELVESYGDRAEKIEIVAELGNLTTVIDYLRDIYEIDYIVMGTKGASGLEEIFIGSNAYDVVKDVECPVIIVPEKANFEKRSKIVFAADFSRIDDTVVLAPLINFVKESNAELHIINVLSADDDDEAKKSIEKLRLEKYFKTIENHSFHNVIGDSISEEIDKYVKSVDAEMLVMLARKNGFFDAIFKTRVTRKVVLHTSVPVLVLHDKQ